MSAGQARAARACAVGSGPKDQFPPQQGARAPSTVECLSLGPLSARIERWRALAAPEWVVRTLERGYRLQFANTPPRFHRVIFSLAKGESARILQEEITTLLSKGAVREIPQEQSQCGFYSKYFLVPKKGGGLRPILDLRALNQHLRSYKFRMLTPTTQLHVVRPGDWFTSIDLKDAYFHIPIYPPHRKFLRFAFQGRMYEYQVLPFGLSLSPRVFVKCTEAAIAPLKRRGIRIASYIDNWLLLSESEIMGREHTRLTVDHLMALGFTINYEKSVLQPAQAISFIGIALNSKSYRACLSVDRAQKMLSHAGIFQLGRYLPFRKCLQMLGLMASSLAVIPLGRLHMREFQQWVASLRLNQKCHTHRHIRVTADCAAALHCWRNPTFLTQGVSLGAVTARKVVTTDASLTGWGATHEGRAVSGSWDSQRRGAHINWLELLAAFLALRHFLPLLRNHHVLIRTDNTTVVAYINRQGGLHSCPLHMLARRLIMWSSINLLSLRATHIPGALNLGADLMSRGNPQYGDWTLHPHVVTEIWTRFGQPQVDLFASRENAQCPLYFSLRHQEAPLGVDALAHNWPHALLYAFPPLALISPTLTRVREKGLTVILIAPRWTRSH
ncbi:Ran GTPase-activating protein 1 [Sarotherodon galilaeus]